MSLNLQMDKVELRCGIDSRDDIELEVFEEFLRAEKPELDKETAVAEAVWRSAETQYKNRLEKYRKDLAERYAPGEVILMSTGYGGRIASIET